MPLREPPKDLVPRLEAPRELDIRSIDGLRDPLYAELRLLRESRAPATPRSVGVARAPPAPAERSRA